MPTKYLLCFSPMLLATVTCSAGGLYIGAGLSSIQLHSEHPSVNSKSGVGYTLLAGQRGGRWGYEAEALLGLEFDTGETPGIYYPPDSAEYGTMSLGVKRYFAYDDNTALTPWVGGGVGFHFITWDTFWYNVDGMGPFLSGGVDYSIAHHVKARAGLAYHTFTNDDTYNYGPYDNNSTFFSFALLYAF